MARSACGRCRYPVRSSLITVPGCKPPLAAPLGNFRRVDNTAISDPAACADNATGFTLPEQNVAISGATAGNAAFTTPGQAQNPLYDRILREGQTQITAMRSMSPTFVSVEFGAYEILPALNGLVSAAESFGNFSSNYTLILSGLKLTGAQALLVLLPTDVRKFPSIRTAKSGVAFDLSALLTSSAPFGALISLDGVHPSAAGQAVLAGAAKAGIIQTYGSITH